MLQTDFRALEDFYPRSPCGERRYSLMYPSFAIFISIHALLAESDWDRLTRRCQIEEFLSTLSLRRATLRVTSSTRSHPNFYPRSPCGERPVQIVVVVVHALFLSTLSLRRATARRASRQQPAGISIHALLAESDSARPEIRRPCAISIHALLAESDLFCLSFFVKIDYYFYPRSPCGERPPV